MLGREVGRERAPECTSVLYRGVSTCSAPWRLGRSARVSDRPPSQEAAQSRAPRVQSLRRRRVLADACRPLLPNSVTPAEPAFGSTIGRHADHIMRASLSGPRGHGGKQCTGWRSERRRAAVDEDCVASGPASSIFSAAVPKCALMFASRRAHIAHVCATPTP